MNESTLTRKLCDCLEAAGAVTHSLVGGLMQPTGLADRIVHHQYLPGCMCWLEAKVMSRELSPRQRHIMNENAKRGVATIVARYIDGGEKLGLSLLDRYENPFVWQVLSWDRPKREMGRAVLITIRSLILCGRDAKLVAPEIKPE